MDVAEIALKYVDVLVWPATLTFILFVYRKPIVALLQKSKIKISLYGVEVETTLAELEATTLAMLDGSLDKQQLDLLVRLANEGPISYDDEGIPKQERRWIRPIMNAGLVLTLPRNAHLGRAKGLDLTPLGRLLMQSRMT